MSSTLPAVKDIFEVDEFVKIQYEVSRESTPNRKTWQVFGPRDKVWGPLG